jgi:hypothetical protein
MNVCFVCARGPEQQIPDVEVLSNKENLVLYVFKNVVEVSNF